MGSHLTRRGRSRPAVSEGHHWQCGRRSNDARRVSRLDEFRRDVGYGVRLLRRSPVFTIVMLGTLAVAIGTVATAFSITDAWLFRPLAFPAADRLVVAFMATAARPTEPAVWMPYRAYLSWKDSARSFSSVSGAFFQGATWRTATDARSLVGMKVTPEFFSTFGVAPLRGRPLAPADAGGPPAVVLSYGFWQRELGASETVVGGSVTLSDVSYTVVGVMPPVSTCACSIARKVPPSGQSFAPASAGTKPAASGRDDRRTTRETGSRSTRPGRKLRHSCGTPSRGIP